MSYKNLHIDGLILFKKNIHPDDRGCFWESFRLEEFNESGTRTTFLQENISVSKKSVVRGLHFNLCNPQAQLLTVVDGLIYDVVVDLRIASPTFCKWIGLNLGAGPERQLYMPPGFAHGFCVLSDSATLHYSVSEYYNALDTYTLAWDDQTLNIPWPVNHPVVSKKDQRGHSLQEVKSMLRAI